jgi:hypothetical protein
MGPEGNPAALNQRAQFGETETAAGLPRPLRIAARSRDPDKGRPYMGAAERKPRQPYEVPAAAIGRLRQALARRIALQKRGPGWISESAALAPRPTQERKPRCYKRAALIAGFSKSTNGPRQQRRGPFVPARREPTDDRPKRREKAMSREVIP